MPTELRIEYCGEWRTLAAGERFTIGRSGHLAVDDNPELEETLLEVYEAHGLWWIASTAETRTVQIADPGGRVSARLAPGERVPLVFEPAHVVFAAGRTTYELTVHGELPYTAVATAADTRPARVELPRLTLNQRLLLVVLCERALRSSAHPGGLAASDFPSSSDAAARLGWSLTAFNRKLDNVCDRLDRAGVPGLRGGRGNLATRRRARLVEYAVASRLVTAADLALLPALDLAA